MTEQINRDLFLKEWQDAKAAVLDHFSKQTGVLESMGLSGRDMGEIYGAAYNAFLAEDYAQAENLFIALFLLDMKERAFQTGLAGTYEAQEKYGAAIPIYALALALEEGENPELMFRMGKCLMATEKREEAMVLFELSALCAPKNAKAANAVERSRKMLALLSN